jgi:hypothetical protein
MTASKQMRRWKGTFGDESCPLRDTMGKVNGQNSNGRSADGSSAYEGRALPTEMARPFLTPRIEKPGALAGPRINASKVRPFMIVIGQASKRQV